MGLYNPGDGHVDPYSLTQAIAKGARHFGAQILQHVEVTGLEQTPTGGWTVETNKGVIKSKRVVNAAGLD